MVVLRVFVEQRLDAANASAVRPTRCSPSACIVRIWGVAVEPRDLGEAPLEVGARARVLAVTGEDLGEGEVGERIAAAVRDVASQPRLAGEKRDST